MVIAACSVCLPAMIDGQATGSQEPVGALAACSDPGISEDAAILARRLHQASSDNLIMDDAALLELGQDIDRALTLIRTRHPRMAGMSARRWHRPSVLLLDLEGDLLDTVVVRWENGSITPLPRIGHAAFDELNAEAGLHKADVLPALSTVIMSLGPCVNLRVARKAYTAVKGVRRASFDESPGDGPDIVAANPGGTWHVAMRHAWGDCPSGCTQSETFLFVVRRGSPEQVPPEEAGNNPQWRVLIQTLEQNGIPWTP